MHFESDSQPEQNFKSGKVAQEDQAHVREIIEKGKKILPSYDDETLYGLYKRYYSVQNIFINELNMIARRLKGDQQNGEDKKKQDWIKVGRQIKTKVNKSKYNFLEDKDLLRRAQLYMKNKYLAPERRPNFNNDQKRQNDPRENNNQKNQQNGNQSYREQKPKQKYVEKIEDKNTQKIQEQKNQTEASKKVESAPVNKVEAPAVQTKVETVRIQEKKTVAQEKPITQNQKVQDAPKKEETIKQSQPALKQKNVQSIDPKPVQQKTIEQKPVSKPQSTQKSQPVTQTPKPAPQTPAKQNQSVSASHSIPTVQNFDPVLAAKNFEQACSQNSFILKFIQPQNYPQRISYIRTQDGGMKNVQIRVTGTSTGSQKKL